ncbi:MAG: nitrous oxide reductase family maturation protein NosD [Caldilineaceae bacterium]|nr:nitrous oxide reductase family maturation protein NosD [Caldilineaceae bacterium]
MTIENNRLEDVLFGIYLKEAPGSIIRDNVIGAMDLSISRRGDGIRAWYSSDTQVEGNHVSDGRDVIMWFSPNGVVRGNTVERGRYGLHFMFSDNQIIEQNVLRDNSVGIFAMYGTGLELRENLLHDNRGPSGYGIGLKEMNDVVATGNRFVNNRIGAYVDNSPLNPSSTLRFANNLFAYNDAGITLLPLVSRNLYTENIFQENGEQISIQGGGVLKGNDWSEAGRGNYWSDYAGYDADADQIGETPYASTSLYEDMLATHPELRLFQGSPVTEALDLAAKAFPLFAPRAKMTDEHPLMRPPTLPAVPGATAGAGNQLADRAGADRPGADDCHSRLASLLASKSSRIGAG